jgi:hypothetical protein
VKVRDARGYLVRRATVTLRSLPRCLIGRVAPKTTAPDGSASFPARRTEGTLSRQDHHAATPCSAAELTTYVLEKGKPFLVVVE